MVHLNNLVQMHKLFISELVCVASFVFCLFVVRALFPQDLISEDGADHLSIEEESIEKILFFLKKLRRKIK